MTLLIIRIVYIFIIYHSKSFIDETARRNGETRRLNDTLKRDA